MGWDDNKQVRLRRQRRVRERSYQYFESLPENRKLEALNYLRYLLTNVDKQ